MKFSDRGDIQWTSVFLAIVGIPLIAACGMFIFASLRTNIKDLNDAKKEEKLSASGKILYPQKVYSRIR